MFLNQLLCPISTVLSILTNVWDVLRQIGFKKALGHKHTKWDTNKMTMFYVILIDLIIIDCILD